MEDKIYPYIHQIYTCFIHFVHNKFTLCFICSLTNAVLIIVTGFGVDGAFRDPGTTSQIEGRDRVGSVSRFCLGHRSPAAGTAWIEWAAATRED